MGISTTWAQQVGNPSPRNENILQAFVKLKDDSQKDALAARYGARFNVGTRGLYTVLVPADSLKALATAHGVESLDTGGKVASTMDIARELTHADEVLAGSMTDIPYKGQGVIVGVIDNGFDFTHPNFKDAEGNCRIKYVWDQNAAGSAPSDYGYGRLYDGSEQVLAARHDASTDTHGTHVLGIAAGSCDNPYHGIATSADIAIVSTNKTEQGIIDGVDFLVKYAKRRNMPIAINISYGNVLGYKDGNSYFSIMLDRLIEKQEGVTLCIATGNEGHRNSTISGDKRASTVLLVPSYGRDNLFVEGEEGHAYSVSMALYDTLKQQTLFKQTFNTEQTGTQTFQDFGSADKDNAKLVAVTQRNAYSGAPSVSINLSYLNAANEEWQVTIESDGGRYLAECDYGEFSGNGHNDFVTGTSASSIAYTATGTQPIAVGAYVSRTSYNDLTGKNYAEDWGMGELYERSGKGPTFDGRSKPDITAPGASIISSLNSFAASYAIDNKDKVYKENHDGRTYYWGIGNGTSMATPVATGIIALWLQAYPRMTNLEAKDVLSHTAMRDALAADGAGYGKIDALAGLKYILMTTGISHPTADMPLYDTTSRQLILPTRQSVKIYTANGALAVSCVASKVSLAHLSKGVYIVKTGTCAQKIAIR